MSIRIMSLVWERSQHKGSELLLLLAIADNANDQGVAYPSIRTLAKKTRLRERTVQYLLRDKLEPSGELRISTGTGPHGCNEYVIHITPVQTFHRRISSDAKPRPDGGEKAIAPEPNTKPSIPLTPKNLKRLGLTPGSVVWKALLGGSDQES